MTLPQDISGASTGSGSRNPSPFGLLLKLFRYLAMERGLPRSIVINQLRRILWSTSVFTQLRRWYIARVVDSDEFGEIADIYFSPATERGVPNLKRWEGRKS